MKGDDPISSRWSGGRSRMKWFAAILLAAVAWTSLGVTRADASAVDGTWRIEDLILNIFDCQQFVCGRIVWIGDPARRASQCGRTIVWGLTPTGPAEWKSGSILDPDDGKTYRLSAKSEPDGTLNARIFRGIELFGKTKILRRVEVGAFAGRC